MFCVSQTIYRIGSVGHMFFKSDEMSLNCACWRSFHGKGFKVIP